MINSGREWDWMDDIDDCRIHQAIDQCFIDDEKQSRLIKDEEWDFYSGLPNPKWYEEE